MASVLVGMLYYWTTESGYRHLLMKVSTDVSVANQSFRDTQENYLTQLSLLAKSSKFRRTYLDYANSAVSKKSESLQYQALSQQLIKMQRDSDLDFIRLLSTNGCKLLIPQDCSTASSPLLERAMKGRALSGVELFSHERLQKLSVELAQRAVIELSATPNAKPTNKQVENRGMVLHLVYPLINEEGKVLALLSAGVLMNGNATLVDQIKATVYSDESLAYGSVGSVTLFLHDVRISTNVPANNKPGARALGTRVSEQVRQKVLIQGERWLDRAFVVSDWYISGYLPIIDVYDQRVGMIYAGFLEAPFKRDFYRWMWQLLIIFLAMVAICGWVVIKGATGIFKPIEAMVTVMGKIRSGKRLRMQLAKNTNYELQTLSSEFNLMLDQLEQQHDDIEQSAEQLEVKVKQRTHSLNQHISLLKNTREQLIAKEKLAAIGELTAGIAHEINNPTAVILGYLDLLVAELGEAGEKVSGEVELIVQQVDRIRLIINDLLQFSRPQSYQVPLKPLFVNDVVHSIHVLMKHDLNVKYIQLNLDLKASLTINSNRQQLQQVMINLISNAVNACSRFGCITVRTRNWGDKGVLVSVKDNGCGIPGDIIKRIFDPFFSRSEGGTGLGLSVSYSILQGLGAQIAVHSNQQRGSQFYIWLPREVSSDSQLKGG
jgi:two-component system NtrC family sensor kinase